MKTLSERKSAIGRTCPFDEVPIQDGRWDGGDEWAKSVRSTVMDFTRANAEERSVGDASARSESTEGSADADSDDISSENFTGVLLGVAGALALGVLLAVVAALGITTVLLRHM